MRHFKTRKGAFKRKLTKFGDLITFDFVDMGKATEMHKELLVLIRDRYTDMERKAICAYSDSALSFKAAMNEMGIPLDKSLPGRSFRNSVAERNNLFIVDTASTRLLRAGLLASFWPFALNIERLEDGSAWKPSREKWFHSGQKWTSNPVKQGNLRHHPNLAHGPYRLGLPFDLEKVPLRLSIHASQKLLRLSNHLNSHCGVWKNI